MTTKAISVIPLFLLNFSFKFIFPPLLRYFYAPFKKRQKSDTNRPIKIYISLGLFVSLYLIYFFLLLDYPRVCVCVCTPPRVSAFFIICIFPYLFFVLFLCNLFYPILCVLASVFLQLLFSAKFCIQFMCFLIKKEE